MASRDQVHFWKGSVSEKPDTVLNGQNITLGIWTEGQVEPVRQLVSENSALSWQATRYLTV